jgi:L-lactate dehydrogenase complex protein LldG
MTAREAILCSIRTKTSHANSCPGSSSEEIPRNYRHAAASTLADTLHLFEQRLLEYDATITRCPLQDIARTVGQLLQHIQEHVVVIDAATPREWLPKDISFIVDDSLTYQELEQATTVLTGCLLGIAETGSLVLQSGPAQGRRAMTLLPDIHLCIVHATQIVRTVPDAFMRLESTTMLPTTFISGPSATADIEMTRVKGVHGPRFLHVILVEDLCGRNNSEQQ